MSLQLLAKQMEAKGRKGDSMLVHMTPGEVAGLQKLAEAAGGSLSVNPETGLVEANFLKRILESNFLPTAVGLGVGAATLNPYAGAAAGAAVGGMQAKRNDQDVLMGAALGGLSGYGGAGIGSGLASAGNAAVSQAATAANPAVIGPMPGAASGFEAAKAGISGLGTEAGRGAFMQSVGGGAGLLTDASMAAAAPLMAPGKAPGEAPVDDEMYSYEYNPGRTGAERSPMAGTSERKYFNSSYSPMRRIKPSQYGAAQGGLMSLAAGGTTTAPSGTSSEGMTGASKAAFDYLMGRSEDSGFAGQGSGGRGGSGTFSGGDGMYSFDPATGQFTKNPNYRDPEDIERERLAAEAAAAAAAQAAADRERGDREEDERRRRAEEEEARRRAIPNITPPRQSSIVARPPAVIVGDPIADPTPIRGTPLSEPGGDYPYQPGDVIPNTSNVFSTPAPAADIRAYDLDTGLQVGGSYDYSGIDRGAYDSYGGESGGIGASHSDYGDSGYDGNWAEGGLLGLAKGGMKSGGFVIPADVVSMIGEGNTDAGYKRIKSIIPGATAIKGKDGGQSDTVKTSIEGKQRARVAHGEMYIPPETVKRLGGAKKLYAMMDRVRQQATGSKKQIKPVSLKRALA